jgi:hypothetical protein
MAVFKCVEGLEDIGLANQEVKAQETIEEARLQEAMLQKLHVKLGQTSVS